MLAQAHIGHHLYALLHRVGDPEPKWTCGHILDFYVWVVGSLVVGER